MFGRLLFVIACCNLSAGFSGCCHLCTGSCGQWGAVDSGIGGNYGACVTPPGCPECATGLYAAQVNPVQRARAMRLERMRQPRGYGYGTRAPRQLQHAQLNSRRARNRDMVGGGMPFDGMYGYDDSFMYDDLAYGYDEFGDGMMFNDGYGMSGTGWMPSTHCNCQDGSGISGEFAEGEWIEGEWTEEALQQSPTPSSIPGNNAAGEPRPMPTEERVPDPIPVTQDQYYSPLPSPGVVSDGETEIQTSSAGSPVQPVLWVPNGL